MSNITKQSSGSAPVDAIQTINGDTGSITGSVVTIHTDIANNNSGGTVQFNNSGTTSTLNLSDLNQNTLVGFHCGGNPVQVVGGSNTGFGDSALGGLTFGSSNTAVGQSALGSAADATQNVAVGIASLATLISGGGNTAVGALSMISSTGNNNTAIGYSCMSGGAGDDDCTAVGANSLVQNVGARNNAFGVFALNSNDVGVDNVSIGNESGFANTSGSNNTFVGNRSGAFNSTASQNTIIGFEAMSQVNSDGNVAVGYQALNSTGMGSNNIGIGVGAGSVFTTTEANNILIGNVGVVGDSDTIRIGTNQTSCFIAGIAGVTVANSAAVLIDTTNGELGTIASSERYKENIEDMHEDVSVLSLRPVKFNYKTDDQKTTQYGLIAEEVAKDFPYLCVYNKENQPETVKYHELCIFLLAEIKRLDKRIQQLESA